MSAMFRSFSVFNYRVWFIGALVSNIGAWMQATAISWVVLTELTDNDPAAMGVTMALQFGPPLLLVGVTGWVADRFDRRKLLVVTQSLLLLVGVAIGILQAVDRAVHGRRRDALALGELRQRVRTMHEESGENRELTIAHRVDGPLCAHATCEPEGGDAQIGRLLGEVVRGFCGVRHQSLA